MRGLVVIGLLGALGAGCLTTDLPDDRYVARRHACTSLENHAFSAANGDKLLVLADDTAYSTFEWTRVDGTVTTGLVQCEDTPTSTLLYADASSSISGRVDGERVVLSQVVWHLER